MHIDKRFTDYAWGDMRKLLDKELPVQGQPRRRFGWWWFVTLGLVLVMAGTGVFFSGKRQPSAVTVPAKPVAGTLSNPTTDQSPSPEKTTLPAVSSSVIHKDSDNGEVIVQASSSKSEPKPKANTSAAKGSKIVETARKEITGKQASKSVSKLDIATNKQEPITNAAVASSHQAAADALPAKRLAPAMLDMSGLGVLSHPVQSSPAMAPSLEDPFPAKWKMALQGDGMAALNNPASGFSLKGMLAKSLGNSRWSFETGLGYSFLQQPLTVVVHQNNAGISNLDEGEIVYGTSSSAVKSASAQQSSAVRTDYSEPLDLHYAVLPVQFSYGLSNRLSVAIGLEGGLLITSSSAFADGGLLDNRSASFVDYLDSTGAVKDIKLASFDMAATGGLGFKVSPAFSLHAGYKLGFKDILPNNKAKDFNRFLQLGFRYYLGSNR